MGTLGQLSRNLEKLNEKAIVDALFSAVKKAEDEFIRLNKSQLAQGEDYLGNIVGVYAKDTQWYADYEGVSVPKTAGDPYNFSWTDDFYKGFELTIKGDEAVISSKGVGSGSKKNFLINSNLFGLNNENLDKVIKDEILPFLLKFSRKTLNI